MMKKIAFLFIGLLAFFSSCNSEDDFLNSFPTLDDVQYSFYVAEALDAMNMPRPEGSYNYPCLPGMPEWKELSSEEMKKVCLISEKILKKQSTQAVIQAMWEHPKFSMLIGFSSNSSIQQSLEKVLPDWDIYIELIKRPDAASCLVERYYRINLTKSIHGFYNNSLQLLLSQTFFLDQLSVSEKTKMAKEIVSRIEVINKIEGVEIGKDAYCTESSYFCLARIMVNSGYAPILAWIEDNETAQKFEKEGDVILLTSDLRKEILDLSFNFINEE